MKNISRACISKSPIGPIDDYKTFSLPIREIKNPLPSTHTKRNTREREATIKESFIIVDNLNR